MPVPSDQLMIALILHLWCQNSGVFALLWLPPQLQDRRDLA